MYEKYFKLCRRSIVVEHLPSLIIRPINELSPVFFQEQHRVCLSSRFRFALNWSREVFDPSMFAERSRSPNLPKSELQYLVRAQPHHFDETSRATLLCERARNRAGTNGPRMSRKNCFW